MSTQFSFIAGRYHHPDQNGEVSIRSDGEIRGTGVHEGWHYYLYEDENNEISLRCHDCPDYLYLLVTYEPCNRIVWQDSWTNLHFTWHWIRFKVRVSDVTQGQRRSTTFNDELSLEILRRQHAAGLLGNDRFLADNELSSDDDEAPEKGSAEKEAERSKKPCGAERDAALARLSAEALKPLSQMPASSLRGGDRSQQKAGRRAQTCVFVRELNEEKDISDKDDSDDEKQANVPDLKLSLAQQIKRELKRRSTPENLEGRIAAASIIRKSTLELNQMRTSSSNGASPCFTEGLMPAAAPRRAPRRQTCA